MYPGPAAETREPGHPVLRNVVAAVALLLPAFAVPSGTPGLPSGAVVVALSATVVVSAAMWRPAERRIGLAAVVTAVSALSLALDAAYFGPPGMALLWSPFELTALLVLLGRSVRLLPSNRVMPVVTAAAVAALALPLRFTLHTSPPKWDASVLGLACVLFLLPFVIGVGLYLRGLDARRVAAVAEARGQQRLEVARVLHDFVAHEVTGMVVEVQAAQFASYDEAEARAVFAHVEEAGLRALASMDRTVAALRDPDGAGADETARLYSLADLPDLVDRFARGATGARVRCDLADAALGRLDREGEAVGYAVVLEALTNVRRHVSDVGAVTVVVSLSGGTAVEVSVLDDGGRGAAPAVPRSGGGSGLIALRERIEVMGGALEAGPRGSGWRVAASLPVPDPTGRRARRLT
ncbi:sensor histidine kinase [Umezawaea beigongshangensis]|uniref:sensor histidine kinase n=1 Tax=Umezawaea beigongshangensis TaxID=2780383 RepID=UPI0018F1BE81|nr:histidine kinase [Umezawaea beigongshangensis]